MRIREGDWVTFRSRGLSYEMKVLEVRPDDKLVVGDHDHDPDSWTIDPDDVTEKIE